MTEAWKASVIARLQERGMQRNDLALALGVSKSVITLMLGPGQTASSYVPAVSKVLDLPMPTLGADNELLAVFGQLAVEDQETLLTIAKRMLK